MQFILNSLREFKYRIAYHALSFSSRQPDTVVTNKQNQQQAVYWIPSINIKRQSRRALFAHPPSQLTYRLTIASKAIFRVFVALKPDVWGKNPGGVEFNVTIEDSNNGRSIRKKILSHPTRFILHRRWTELCFKLDDFEGHDVDITISTTIPQETTPDYAWAVWGDPTILTRRKFFEIWPLNVIKNFKNFLISIYQNSYMIRSMVLRDLRARYVGSFLGIFWSVIHPLTQLLIYYFIFSVILKIKLGPEFDGTNFAMWLVAGLLPWMFFAEIVTRSPGAVLEQSSLITKTVFPSEILPLVHLIAAIINHLIGMVIFLVFLLIFGQSISLKIFLILPFMLTTCIFALGIAWLISALNVFLRDVGQIIGVFVNIWFFLTPIIYPRHLIPDNFQTLYGLNPMLHAVEAYRVGLLGKTELYLEEVSYVLLLGLFTFVVGGLIFRKLKPAFADVL